MTTINLICGADDYFQFKFTMKIIIHPILSFFELS